MSGKITSPFSSQLFGKIFLASNILLNCTRQLKQVNFNLSSEMLRHAQILVQLIFL